MSTAATTTPGTVSADAGKSAANAAAEKKKRILTVAGVVVGIGVLYFIYETLFYVTTDNAQIRANTLMLSPKVTGFISKVNVEENMKVKAGDPLVEIDSRDYQTKSSAAESEVAGLRARASDAKRNFERLNDLFKAGAVSQQQRDTAEANYSELSKRLKALESQFDLSKLTLADTQVRAPSDGVIAKKNAEVGMLASPGVPLFGFVSSDGRWVVANFKETDLDRIHAGQKVEVKVDAVSSRTFEGVVESVSPATGSTFTLLPPDNATGNFTKVVQRVPVRIRLQNLSVEDIDLLRAGLSADVKVKIR